MSPEARYRRRRAVVALESMVDIRTHRRCVRALRRQLERLGHPDPGRRAVELANAASRASVLERFGR